MMTPHTTPQLAKQNTRFLNQHIRYRRITVEHAIAEMKVYRDILDRCFHR